MSNAQSAPVKTTSVSLVQTSYQPQSLLNSMTRLPQSGRLQVSNRSFGWSQNLQTNNTQPMVMVDPDNDRLAKLYDNLVINFTILDEYALKYKLQNPALYEAGRNTIFSQVENPFSRNLQF
ncbi:hypothetical protein BST86_08410 [Nonlabens agnitus]|uniref:Uncharacterized protein n=2 Tax=Nonlabens agnitus TaxID=870484 RepID=A0A2S9WUI1_9FLAO|nr:hypothetical protein BST86_08410 [Nonlabens agnitus]